VNHIGLRHFNPAEEEKKEEKELLKRKTKNMKKKRLWNHKNNREKCYLVSDLGPSQNRNWR
jgi:hypothetical protein